MPFMLLRLKVRSGRFLAGIFKALVKEGRLYFSLSLV